MEDERPTDPLTDALLNAYAEVCRKRDKARQTLQICEADLRRVEAAAGAVGLNLSKMHEPNEPADGLDEDPDVAQMAPSPPQTMKQAALLALKMHGRPMTTVELLPCVNDLLGTGYARGSLSPQLSRLLQDGSVTRDGDRWKLV